MPLLARRSLFVVPLSKLAFHSALLVGCCGAWFSAQAQQAETKVDKPKPASPAIPSTTGSKTPESDEVKAEYFINKCPEGFQPIFDGKTLAGWKGCPGRAPSEWKSPTPEDVAKWTADRDAHWSVSDAAIVNDGSGVYLTTEKSYGDFELLLQYKTVPKADSGIYLRGTPQVQIWDTTNADVIPLGANKGSGGLWNNSPGAAGKDPKELADNPFGDWNQFRIRLIGERCSVWLNGKHVVDNAPMENYWDRKQALFATGPIQLQTHGGEIQWRNIYLKEISAVESNKILLDRLGSDFRPIFDGKTLDGWAGAVDGYTVVDGAIQCREGSGGVLHTSEKYSDFEVALEFKLPVAGNNGLAIRYPGTGDAAYSAMCELQVLHNKASVYDSIDPRQRHGSAYGMVAAKTGYLREPGVWNFQHVTVEGSRIVVELNGTKILDADLSTVSQYLADREHPGKDLKSGHFGFAGHGDSVQYRNIRMK
jgi:hypothetical protein